MMKTLKKFVQNMNHICVPPRVNEPPFRNYSFNGFHCQHYVILWKIQYCL